LSHDRAAIIRIHIEPSQKSSRELSGRLFLGIAALEEDPAGSREQRMEKLMMTWEERNTANGTRTSRID
jgi:hypothetical protein